MQSRTILAATAPALLLALAACSSNGASNSPTRPATASSTSASHAGTSATSARATSTSAGSSSTTGSVRPALSATTTAPSAAGPTSAGESSATSSPGTGGVDPNAPEGVEPGDIPDNQVFIPYASPDGTFTIKVPEGWARTDQPGGVLFSDKYNLIAVTAAASARAPDPQSVSTAGIADVAGDPTFQLGMTRIISRPAGQVVLVTYSIGSPPNPVTGKKALLVVERYVYYHNGRTVTLTLSGANGADNVDPWKVISDSLTWTA